MGINKNTFFVGAVREPSLRLVLLLVLSLGLSACKIDLKIFGTGTVESDSGSMACSNNDPDSANQSGDCSQEYVTVITDCEGYGVPDHDEWAELPNCTLVTTEAPITETLLASPNENDTFDGWDGDCLGAGNCEITVDAGDADDQEAVMTVEAHFDEEPAPQDAIYTYNYLGQRASKTVNGVITYFVYDEAGNLLSEIDGNNSTPNNIKSRKNYVYLEGEYVAHVEYTGDTNNSETQAQIFYPLNDHLGQPIAMLRADAQISHEQYTDPFGKMHAQYLNTGVGTGPEPQNKKLPGQYFDRETGYHDNHMRTYLPDAGIYFQADWLDVLGRTNDPALRVASMMGALQLPQYMQQNHLYGYANQNPVMNIDPYGLYHCAPGANCNFSPAGHAAMMCYDTCTGLDNTVTSGLREGESSQHGRGDAADMNMKDNPCLTLEKAKQCSLECFGYGQQEQNGQNSSDPDGMHFHEQVYPTAPGKGGWGGTRPYQPSK